MEGDAWFPEAEDLVINLISFSFLHVCAEVHLRPQKNVEIAMSPQNLKLTKKLPVREEKQSWDYEKKLLKQAPIRSDFLLHN